MLTVQRSRCQNQNTPVEHVCKDTNIFCIFANVRKNLISLAVLLALCSCASVRRATPIDTRELKPYPVSSEGKKEAGKADEKKPSIPQEKPSEAAVKGEEKKVSAQALSDQVIAYAREFLGVPYKLGAAGPRQFDCSHFTTYVFGHFGYKLTPYTVTQITEGREVESFSDLQKGDLVFFGKRGSVRNIGHVGIVVSVNYEKGSFNFIHASVSKGVAEDVSTHPYYQMRYIGARRVLPDE